MRQKYFPKQCFIIFASFLIFMFSVSSPTATTECDEIIDVPIAYWAFDNGIGSTAIDGTINANDGMINGATWTTGYSGNALNLDGDGDYIEIADSPFFDSMTTSGTILVWVKQLSLGSIDMYVSKPAGGYPKNQAFSLGYHGINNYFLALFGDGKTGQVVTFNADAQLGVWTQVGITWDGTYFKTYINGQLDNTVPQTLTPAANDAIVNIGRWTGYKSWDANVVIDEVAIYDRSLSAEEIVTRFTSEKENMPPTFSGLESATETQTDGTVELSWKPASDNNTPITYNIYYAASSGSQNFSAPNASTNSTSYRVSGLSNGQPYYFVVRAQDVFKNEENNIIELSATPICNTCNIPPGVVAYWTFDEGSGNSIFDGTNSTNNGNIKDASWTTGQSGNALSFDGSGDYVEIQDSPSLDSVTSSGTIIVWVKQLSLGSIDMYISKPKGGWSKHQAFSLGYHGINNYFLGFFGDGKTGQTVTFNADAQLGVWTQVGITWDGTNFKTYVNGQLDNTVPQTLTPAANDATVNIGRWTGYGSWDANALIDEMLIYNRALTAEEIQEYFNTTIGQ